MKTFKLLVVIFLSSSLSGYSQTVRLTEEKKVAFQEMALEQTEALSNYINILCDKQAEPDQKDKAMNQALKLFFDEERIVSISSKTRDNIRKQKIRPYLNHLRVLPYERVEITWYDVGYVSDLKPGTDGRYHATITLFQKFVGYGGDDKIVYQDVTQKNIDVILDTQVIRIGDWVDEQLVIRLGDISVVQTR